MFHIIKYQARREKIQGQSLDQSYLKPSDHFTKDSFDESQELKRHPFSGNLKYIRKPDVPILISKWKGR